MVRCQANPEPFALDAWVAGRLCFTWKLTQMVDTEAATLDEKIETVLRLGWELRTASVSHGSLGHETVLFVFVRPT
jgi:hypothetical protein